MLLQAALNGPLTKADLPAVPVSLEELAADAAACVAAGARAFHVHPRDDDGAERLEAEIVDRVVTAVREGHGHPVGVTTGAWIEPDVRRRVALVSRWTAPDYTSVNLSEGGALDVIRAVLDGGVGVEAGVWTVADAEFLVASGLADRLTRVLVEPVDLPRAGAVAFVAAIHDVLDRGGVTVPRLQHGDGESTWVLIEDSAARGIDTRVGFEDTLLLPDGAPAASNAELVAAARDLGAGGV